MVDAALIARERDPDALRQPTVVWLRAYQQAFARAPRGVDRIANFAAHVRLLWRGAGVEEGQCYPRLASADPPSRAAL